MRECITLLLDAQTYLTGTMRKNKKELPSIVKTNGTLHSSLFFEDVETGTVLTIYQCKSNKNVVVLSTEIDEALVPTKIDLKRKYVGRNQSELFKSNEKSKPSSILAYNNHKAGVDSVDQMTRTYNVKFASRRWPVQVFLNILNLVSINSWVLFKETIHKDQPKTISRRQFLIQLVYDIIGISGKGKGLVSPRNSTLTPLPPAARLKRLNSLESPPAKKRLIDNTNTPEKVTSPKPYCKLRINCSNNKSLFSCAVCNLPSCGKCSSVLTVATCFNCKQD
jgi:hypothetical protein